MQPKVFIEHLWRKGLVDCIIIIFDSCLSDCLTALVRKLIDNCTPLFINTHHRFLSRGSFSWGAFNE